jgi:uncharacterized membrane protein YczE
LEISLLGQSETATDTAAEQKIDSTFRNGSLTAVGIILGFSLNFLSRWAANPNDWSRIDILPLVTFIMGIGLQIKVLADLLGRDSLLVSRYDRSMRMFLVGILIVALGIAIALTCDILGLSKQNMLG